MADPSRYLTFWMDGGDGGGKTSKLYGLVAALASSGEGCKPQCVFPSDAEAMF